MPPVPTVTSAFSRFCFELANASATGTISQGDAAYSAWNCRTSMKAAGPSQFASRGTAINIECRSPTTFGHCSTAIWRMSAEQAAPLQQPGWPHPSVPT